MGCRVVSLVGEQGAATAALDCVRGDCLSGSMVTVLCCRVRALWGVCCLDEGRGTCAVVVVLRGV